MAIHEADGYKKQVHSGLADDSVDQSRIVTGSAKDVPVPATKVVGTKDGVASADSKGRNQSAPGNL